MKKLLFPLLITMTVLYAVPMIQTFTFDDSLMYEGIGSNSVTDMAQISDSVFFFSTENGLSFTQDRGETFSTFYSSGKTVRYGAVTGLAVLGEHIWVATAYDSSVYDGLNYSSYPVGNGVSYSPDAGETWQRFPQSVDDVDDNYELAYGDTIPALPITSRINNITYDLAVNVTSDGDTLLWSTNFAGGTRCSSDKGSSWQRVILPPDYYDSFNEDTPRDFDLSPTNGSLGYESNLNHRAFSVDARGDTVVVGTADGINISYDAGLTWQKYNSANSGICGNFIVDITLDAKGNIYGSALATVSEESRGLVRASRNVNGLLYWETDLEGTRIYSVAVGKENRLYAATEDKLWYSSDGWNWVQIPQIADDLGQLVLDEKSYSAMEDEQGMLWVGTGDGLAVSQDFGFSWRLVRRVRSEDDGEAHMSAYPNPFSSTRMNVLGDQGYVRIHCEASEASIVSIEIYDYSMQRVKSLVKDVAMTGTEAEFLWNARNGLGNTVANGVYFIKMTLESNGSKELVWDKLIILN